MFWLNTIKKNESEENNHDAKGAAKQMLVHMGLRLGGKGAIRNADDMFVEGCCLISALRADQWSDRWKFVSL